VIHRRCRRANMVSTYPKLLVAYLPGIVLVCLAGIVLAAGLVALYPCRDARDTRFDALTVTIAGAPLGHTTYDRAVVRGVQEQLARSSVLQFPALLASLVLPRPFRAQVDQPQARTPTLAPRYLITLKTTPLDGREKTLVVEYTPPTGHPLRPGRCSCGKRSVPAPTALLEQLLPLLEAAKRASRGELVNWELADKLLPRFAVAEIVDIDSGRRFFVQRRAGTNHADVQPLTAHDTETMKRIVGGSWTWDRKPVLVVVGGRTLAGSINGMPHGAGAIRANEFPGHFCLYFLGSRTHATGRVDPEHLLAVLRAAGLRVEGLAGESGK